MIKKRNKQPSFAQFQLQGCLKTYDWLKKVNQLVDWSTIERKLAHLHPSNTGRPAYNPVLMFKILLLQQWFNLSDSQAEAQVNDIISFKFFLGLDNSERSRDETTVCGFRDGSGKLAEELLEDVKDKSRRKATL